jgi:hypothetical protein
MRIGFGLYIILVCFSGALCNAQCADTFTEMNFHCSGPGGCEDQVAVFIPNESQYGVFIECGSEDCCGQLFSTCWGTGNCEPARALRSPDAQDQLARLSLESRILVSDCSGRYILFTRPPDRREIASFARLDDHVLR